MRQFFLGLKFVYYKIALILVLGVFCAFFVGAGVVGLVTGAGGGPLIDLVMACCLAYLCVVVRGDVQRQRRRFADPSLRGFQTRKEQ